MYIPGLLSLSGGEHAQCVNASGSTIVAGSGVVITGCLLGAPVAGVQAGIGTPSLSFALPGGTVTAGSLGVLCDDIAAGDTGFIVAMGLVGALSDGTGGLNQPLTIDTAGRLKIATGSGTEVFAFGASVPTGGRIWAHLVSPFPLP